MTDYSLTQHLADSSEQISLYILILLGIVPTVATLTSIARHIFGFKGLNMYTPIIMAIVFYEVSIIPGIFFSLAIFGATAFVRRLLRQYRMHYFVKISFFYSIVCLMLFLITVCYMVTAKMFDIENSFRVEAVFPILLLITLIEEFFTKIIKEGSRRTLPLVLESIIIASLAYFAINYIVLSKFVSQNVWVLLFLFPINALLAGYEGLRISELFRFREVIEEEKEKLKNETK